MATRSTASSGTEGPTPGPRGGSRDAADRIATTPRRSAGSRIRCRTAACSHDAERRAFFFQFGKQAVTAVGQVAGMADIVGRTSSGARRRPARPRRAAAPHGSQPCSRAPASAPMRSCSAATPAAEDSFRSAYRLSRRGAGACSTSARIPEALDEVVARRGSDVAYYLRLGVARGGPVMAQAGRLRAGPDRGRARRRSRAEQRDVELRRTERRARRGAAVVAPAGAGRWSGCGGCGRSSTRTHPARRWRPRCAPRPTPSPPSSPPGEAAIAATLAEALPRPEDGPLARARSTATTARSSAGSAGRRL